MANLGNELLESDIEIHDIEPSWKTPNMYGDIIDKQTPQERTLSFEGGWQSKTDRQKFTKRGDGKLTSAFGLTMDDPIVKKYLDLSDIIQGLPKDKAQKIASERYKVALEEVPKLVPNIAQQPPQVQELMADLHYNMGITGLLKFPNFIQAINEGDYKKASNELKYVDGTTKKKLSKYYNQTGRRAKWNINILNDLSNNLEDDLNII